jgi:HPt (histidine-containing phosphotransfer) domain-containing protein
VTEFPTSLPGIDVASGLARVAKNQKLYLKLLRTVAAGADSTKAQISSAIAEGNAQMVRDIAHSLKGSSANLSISVVAAAAESLEAAAKAEDFGSMAKCLVSLETALDDYVGIINTLEGL